MTFSPPSPPFIAARWHGGAQTPKALVIHGTVSPCIDGGARAVAKFFATEPTKTSAHYVSDPHETIQCVGDHAVAYHCGFNQDTIGHELCDPQTGPGARWSDAAHAAMLEEAALTDAQLCLAYGIEIRRPSVDELKRKGPHGIYGHNDSRLAFGGTTHTDPGPAFPWDAYIGLVKAKALALSKPVIPPAILPVEHRVVTANMFVKNAQPAAGVSQIVARVKAAFRLVPDVIAMQETQAMLPKLHGVSGYTLFASTTDGEASRELGVLLRNGLHCLGVEYRHAADGTGKDAFAHARGIFVVKYLKRRRRVAVVNTHMGLFGEAAQVAASKPLKPQALSALLPRRSGGAAQQHATHAQMVAATVARLRKAGFVVFVTADANSRGAWSQSLPAVLNAAGMTVTRKGVDLVASDPQRVRVKGVQTVPHKLTGSDTHNAVAIRATEKRSKA